MGVGGWDTALREVIIPSHTLNSTPLFFMIMIVIVYQLFGNSFRHSVFLNVTLVWPMMIWGILYEKHISISLCNLYLTPFLILLSLCLSVVLLFIVCF